MMKIATLFLMVTSIFLNNCTGEKKKVPARLTELTKLEQMFNVYEELYKTKVDSNGFIDVDACDSLIETGLSNPKANLTAAEKAPGQWLRRPVNYPECFAAGESRSDISRDGIMGVIFWALQNGDLGALNRLWDYGSKHNWIMGTVEKQHSIMTQQLIALLAQSIYKLGGGDYLVRDTLVPYVTPADGFEGHLQAVQVLIKRMVDNEQTGDAEFLQKLYESNNINPLYAWMAGDEAQATELLLNTWPTDRLPTTDDWCTPWRLMQAKDGRGLNPCSAENKTHSGGDFLFVTRLILTK